MSAAVQKLGVGAATDAVTAVNGIDFNFSTVTTDQAFNAISLRK